MDKWLGKYSDFIYALMRIIGGVLFACHGSQKLFALPVGQKQEATLLIVAGVIELVGGILIALGFLASWAAFIASGEMAAAYFKQHAPHGFWPIMQGGNGGELAILYCFVFLYIAALGSGILSVDALLGRSKRP
jgi:putative oxidoreductase